VLGKTEVGVNDNFIALGGHSLSAMQVMSRVRDELGVPLKLRSIFDAPTLVELASEVDRAQAAVPGPAAPPLVPIERAALRRRLRSEIIVEDTREITGFFDAHAAEGTWPGGIHVELTQGREAVVMLNAVVSKMLHGDAALLAGWRVATRITAKAGAVRAPVVGPAPVPPTPLVTPAAARVSVPVREPATVGVNSSKLRSRSMLRANCMLVISWQSPTVRIFEALVTDRQMAVIGLVRFSIQASGQTASMSAAMPANTGMFRRARSTPPGPTLSPPDWRIP